MPLYNFFKYTETNDTKYFTKEHVEVENIALTIEQFYNDYIEYSKNQSCDPIAPSSPMPPKIKPAMAIPAPFFCLARLMPPSTMATAANAMRPTTWSMPHLL